MVRLLSRFWRGVHRGYNKAVRSGAALVAAPLDCLSHTNFPNRLAQHARVFGDAGTGPGLADQVAIDGCPQCMRSLPLDRQLEGEEANLEFS